MRKVESFFSAETTWPVTLLTVKEIQALLLSGKKINFAEHYPLRQKEKAFFLKMNLQESEIWPAPDEPLFMHFGTIKIIQVMKQLGLKEEEAIKHFIISKAIQNAQEKISKKVRIDQTSTSQ